jgi:hypothetical protein
MLALGWKLAAAIGAVTGMMAAIVHLDLDIMSGIQEINDQTNDSSLATSKLRSTSVEKAIL